MTQEKSVPSSDSVNPESANGATAHKMRKLRRIFGATTAMALSLIAAPAMANNKPAKPTIVVVGDSLGAGAKPVGTTGYVTSEGYAGRVAKYKHARLANFACAGATSSSALYGGDCVTLGMPAYGGGSQVDAAERYIKGHRNQVETVIVELGINDGIDPSTTPRLEANMTMISRGLRDAAGRKKKNIDFVGVTYYDPLLPTWLTGDSSQQSIAENSVALVHNGLNTPLNKVYRQNNYKVADLGSAFGNYVPFNQTMPLSGNNVPAAVAEACIYTYGCDPVRPDDIHLRVAGDKMAAMAIETAH